MKESRKIARDWLESLPLSKFRAVLGELKLTPEQTEILTMKHIHGFDNVRIAVEVSKHKDVVSGELSKIYDRVFVCIDYFNG